MKFVLVVVAVLGASQIYGINPPTINKCNDTAIKWVKVIWDANGVPSGIVSKRAKDVKIGLVASTLDYTATGECETAEFSGNSATWTLTNVLGDKLTLKEDFVEDPATPGIVTSSDGKIKRYFVFSKGGVNAYYICSTDGPEGDPQGAVSAKLKPLTTTSLDLVDFGGALLEYVGVVGLNETNVDKCFPKSS